MKTFHDNHDRSWSIAINVDAVKRVRSLLNVDLLQVIEGQLLERLVSDPVLLCDVLYCLCQVEAEGRQVSDEDFGRAMGGDAIDRATSALLEELVDFFPQAKRELLRTALAKLENLQTKAVALVSQRLQSEELDQQLEAELARLWGLIYQLAGILGLDPGRLTLRELVWMAEGRQRDQWAHTATLLALVANVNRDPKKTRAYRPDDFNPFAPRKPRVKAGIDILRQVFVERSQRCPVPER